MAGCAANDKHDMEAYAKLREGADFYLSESFYHINESLLDESAGILFSKYLQEIDPTDVDRKIAESASIPKSTIELLRFNCNEVLSEETTRKMSDAWRKAQMISRFKNYGSGLNHIINSIHILGHLNNFGFFIETIINRHLLLLQDSKSIDGLSYSRIAIAKICGETGLYFQR